MTTDGNLEQLTALGRDIDIALSDARLDQVAALILRLHQARVKRVGGILTPLLARDYAEHTAAERKGMRAAIVEVIRALVLLDLIEIPR
jgi:hypothetical protein